MNIPGPRPATLAGAFAFSIAVHIGLLAWLQPGGRPEPIQPEFPLSVRLQPREPVTIEVAAPPPPRRAARMATAPATRTPHPPLLEPAPATQQPLRLRVVANPADFGASAASAEHRYAWPGEVDVSPLPPEGIAMLYPADALRDGARGLVVTRIDLDRSGGIERLQFICSSAGFEPAVRQALLAVRFRPAFVRNARVPSWMLLEFAFLAGVDQDADPAAAERALAALQQDCARQREDSAQPAR